MRFEPHKFYHVQGSVFFLGVCGVCFIFFYLDICNTNIEELNYSKHYKFLMLVPNR